LNIEHYAYDSYELSFYDEGPLYKPVEWIGAVVEVHDIDIEPTPHERGILVAPGTLNRLTITQVNYWLLQF